MPYDIKTKEFWDEEAVDTELHRIFDICHGCRLCYNLCPSFNFLLDTIDEKGDAEVSGLTKAEKRNVVDLCYQCKLCFPKCPYTPPHKWEVDIPRLFLRERAVRAKKEGIKLQDKVLGNTDFIGKLGSSFPALMNWANKNKMKRFFMEKTVGIHRDRKLPEYHGETFEKWFKNRNKQSKKSSLASKGKVILFYTCSVNYNNPEIGKAVVKVLERNKIEVICPKQKCCGMPYLDGGDFDSAIQNIKFNTQSLLQAVRDGYEIVIPGPSCSLMMKQEYPWLHDTEESKLISSHSYDICEYLVKLDKEGKLDKAFDGDIGKIVYHQPCHLVAQNIGYKSKDVMQLIPGVEVESIQKCSGMDGTWGLKVENFEESLKVASKVFKKVENEQPATPVSDCSLASLQIDQGTGMMPVHPIQILHKAYGLDKNRNEKQNK